MNLIRLCTLSISLIVTFSCFGQSTSPSLFKLGEESYPIDVFEYYFLKNSEKPDPENAEEKVKEYLELYIDFRLKVQEATALDMHKDPAFIKELEGYDAQLIEPFMMTSKINEDLIREAYERLKYEVSGSHILLRSPQSNLPEDTLKVYNRLEEIKLRIENGEDFGDLAARFSEDPSARQNKGYLGYFTSMQMVYPFENAAYENEVGDIVGPFKTRFGYHLLQIQDKRPSQGQISTAHIMVRFTTDTAQNAKAEDKIRSIHKNLLDGKDWNEQCKLYSDDTRTKDNGGKLRWFSSGQLVPEFEKAAFAMNTVDSISDPVRSKYGWHIIKLLEKKGLESFEEKKEEIEKRIARDERTAKKQSAALNELRKKHSYKSHDMTRQLAFDKIDSTLLKGKWKLSESSDLDEKSLFQIGDSSYTVSAFWEYVIDNQKARSKATREEYLDLLYNRFEQSSIFDYEKAQIKANNAEYRMILDEYRSGILLFNLMQKQVWDKAVQDTTGLRKFFDENIMNYEAQEKAIGRKLVLSDTTQLDLLQASLNEKTEKLDSLFNTSKPLTLQISNLSISQGESDFLDSQWTVGDHLQKDVNYITVWQVSEIVPKGFEKLEDVKGKAIADYQDELERNWLASLREKYPVKVNKKTLKNYIKSIE